MPGFPWFPLAHELPGGSVGRLQREGVGYQLIQNQAQDSVFLILEAQAFVWKTAEKMSDLASAHFHPIEFGDHSYRLLQFKMSEQPAVLRDWPAVVGLPTSSEASALGDAVRALREKFPKAEIGSSLFLPEFRACLPVEESRGAQDLHSLAVALLVGGSQVRSTDVGSIRAINSWLRPDEIQAFLEVFGAGSVGVEAPRHALDPSSFVLPGRPELESFFREYVLEPSADRERYAALGVKMPNGVLLYGPAGSGKSHAVEKLVAALGWPKFEFDLGSMGSAFIHQTSVALRKIFDDAKRRAPALVVLEEIDALAASRGPMTHDHKIEEVNELLRLVESASKNNILVVATTNRIDALDPAIRRKGRFDHALKVGYPTAPEVRAALDAMLHDRPHRDIRNIDQITASLAGRPMSDAAWVVNEAARLAARGKKDAIDEIDLFSALKGLKGL